MPGWSDGAWMGSPEPGSDGDEGGEAERDDDGGEADRAGDAAEKYSGRRRERNTCLSAWHRGSVDWLR